MTTIRQIVIDAFREGGLVQVGLTPEADEFDEGLRKLQTIIASLYGNEGGSPLTSINYGKEGLISAFGKADDASEWISAYFVPPNSRLLVNAEEGYTVYLNPNPADGERVAVVDVAGNFGDRPFIVSGNGRRIEGDTYTILETDLASKQWFYRADLGEWVLVSDLTADSSSPFPPEFDELLITSTAMRLNPRYQTQTAPETMMEWRRAKSQFRARYTQSKKVRSDIALVRLAANNGSAYDVRWGTPSFGTGEIIIDGGDA